ncbi:DUF58 domain-containing protein [Acidobacteriota bacterium]
MEGHDSRGKILDPLIIAKIQKLVIRARLIVDGILSGYHASPDYGSSVEFLEHKEYAPGDELRHLDWKVLGKSGRYYIKKFEEETNLRAFLLVDATASMEYGSNSKPKIDYAVMLAASLSYLMLRQRDSVGLLSFGEGVENYIRPNASPDHLNTLLSELAQMRPQGATPLREAVEMLASKASRRGLVMVFSDLLDDAAMISTALRRLRKRKHEVAVFHVLDPAEINFPFSGMTRFLDLESSKQVTCEAGAMAESYRRLFKEHFEGLYRELRSAEIDTVRADTSIAPDKVLIDYLAARGRLRG